MAFSPQTLLSLLNLPGYGIKTVNDALDYLESDISTPREFASFTNSIVGKVRRAKRHTEDTAADAIRRARRIINDSEDAGIDVIGWGGKDYPLRLRTISDPPMILYAKGNLSCLSSDISVALIGTREPSEFGQKSAFRIGVSLAEYGVTVVSGLALGCDTEAHLGCLSIHGKTVAVLAHGLHMISPAKNRPLAERILSEGGCLLSEYELGIEPRRNHFVKRDRIQSGLSDAVIVIETGLTGGSMHTVEFCKAQNRKLASIKHPDKFSKLASAEGNRALIENKRAIPLEDGEDLKGFLRSISDIYLIEKEVSKREPQATFPFTPDE